MEYTNEQLRDFVCDTLKRGRWNSAPSRVWRALNRANIPVERCYWQDDWFHVWVAGEHFYVQCDKKGA